MPPMVRPAAPAAPARKRRRSSAKRPDGGMAKSSWRGNETDKAPASGAQHLGGLGLPGRPDLRTDGEPGAGAVAVEAVALAYDQARRAGAVEADLVARGHALIDRRGDAAGRR